MDRSTDAAFLKGAELLAACADERGADALRLVDEGALLECNDEEGVTPLMYACRDAALFPVVARLVAAGANLDRASREGDSALLVACEYGSAAAARLLVESGCALARIGSANRSALDLAAAGGEALADVASAIRARGGPSTLEAEALLPPGEQLRRACEGGRAEDALRLVLARGAEAAAAATTEAAAGAAEPFLEAADEEGWTPLMLASSSAPLDAVAAALVDAGANVNAVTKVGSASALLAACRAGRAATARLLAERVSDEVLNLVDDRARTALDHAAAAAGDDGEGLVAAIRARGGRTARELARAAREALGPAAARVRGERLLAACVAGRAAPALRFLMEGADLDLVDDAGRTPLLLACESAQLDAVAERLIAAGAKLRKGGSALIRACRSGRTATALALVAAGAPLTDIEKGASALDCAEAAGLAGVAAALRLRGALTAAELEARAPAERAAARAAYAAARAALGEEASAAAGAELIAACARGDADDALRLIDAGACLDLKDSDGWTPLIFACRTGDLDAVAERLVVAGAQLDLKSSSGWTALHFACSSGRAASAALLVDSGASPNLVEFRGRTGVDLAASKGFAELVDALRAKGAVAGAEVTRAARAALGAVGALAKGDELLRACATASDTLSSPEVRAAAASEALRLVNDGADVDCIDERGWSSLMYAARHESMDQVAARLVAAGAHVGGLSDGGNSAVIVAVANKRLATAQMLLAAGADPNVIARDDGRTALDWATSRGHVGLIDALEAKGGRSSKDLRPQGADDFV
jgi:ankyrin repeat protein